MDRDYFAELREQQGAARISAAFVDAEFARLTGWDARSDRRAISATITPHAQALLGATGVGATLAEAAAAAAAAVAGSAAAEAPTVDEIDLISADDRLMIRRDALAWLSDIARG